MKETHTKLGRPSGRSPQGEQMKQKLYEVALGLFQTNGYESTTMRGIAKAAEVSPGLFYKYFPSKEAIVLKIYDELSLEFQSKLSSLPKEDYLRRLEKTLHLSLDTLKPHRDLLRSMMSVFAGSVDENIFSPKYVFSRERVEGGFHLAISDSSAKFSPQLIDALGRLTYTVHLTALIFWLNDQSKDQVATKQVLKFFRPTFKVLNIALRLRRTQNLVIKFNKIVTSALFHADEPSSIYSHEKGE